MPNGWRATTLGEVATFASGYAFSPAEQGRSHGDVPFFKVSDMNARGNEVQLTHAANRVDEDALLRLKAKAWRRGTVVFPKVGAALLTEKRRILGRRAAFDNNVMGLVGDSSLILDEFLLLAMSRVRLAEYAQRGAVPSVNQGHVSVVPLDLPPLEVQRRIVDLIAGVDAKAEALSVEAVAGADLQGPLFQGLVARGTEGAESLPLGEVGEFVRGRRFTKDEYVPSGLGCVHYGQIHTGFGPVARQTLTFLPEESRSRLHLARPGDVVIAATSEDLDGLGKATVWLGDDDVAVHDDCYIFRHRLDPKFASYVFASAWFQQQKRQYASGTKVTRISGSDLARIAIPIPPIAVQAQIGEALSGLSEHVNALRVELEAVHQLRSSLLTSLLSRRVEIPKSYDALLARVSEKHLEAS